MIRLLLFTVVLLTAFPLHADNPSADEQAVWKLEEAYWAYVKANDLDGYRTLWDDRFVGWPGFSPEPVGKDQIADWIPPLHANSGEQYDYELTKTALRAFGDDIVVVHYLVRDFFRDPTTGDVVRELDTYRITHTWQRRGDSWQIITGMSGAQAGK